MKIKFGFIAAGLVLFGASFSHPFHFDDALITNDSNVINPARWAHFFNPLYLRQLTFFTFYLNHLGGGLNPAGFHVVNVAIHVANAVLFYLLLNQFFERWIAIAAGAIFLVHPIQTEPVLYVYQRSILDAHHEDCGETTPFMYSVPNLRVTFGRAKRNIGAAADMRGPGVVPGLYAIESGMNELAEKLKIDPQRHRLGSMCARISASLALTFFCSKACARIIMPAMQ